MAALRRRMIMPRVGLVADHHQHHDHRQPGQPVYDRPHLRVGKDPLEGVRVELAQNAGADQDAGDQLTHHRRLSQFVGNASQQPSGSYQQG